MSPSGAIGVRTQVAGEAEIQGGANQPTETALDRPLVGKSDGTRLERIVGNPAAGVLGKGGGEAFPVLLVEGLGLADEGVEVQRREL